MQSIFEAGLLLHDVDQFMELGERTQRGGGPGGRDLSGGLWQRLAIARAFYRDAQLMILDEPTAGLDPRAESELYESLRSVLTGRTAVFISHRFSSVSAADVIYVLD